MDIFLIAVLTFFASAVGTLTGFGTSTIMVPVPVSFFPLSQSLLLVGIVHWFGDIWKILLFREGIRWGLIAKFGITGIAASVLGGLLVFEVPEALLSRMLGAVLLAYVALVLVKSRFKLPETTAAALVGGARGAEPAPAMGAVVFRSRLLPRGQDGRADRREDSAGSLPGRDRRVSLPGRPEAPVAPREFLKLTGRALLAPVAALVLAGCVSAESWEAVRVLKDIEARRAPSELKQRTPAPTRTAVTVRADARAVPADLYHPNQPVGARLVLVPGFTPHGKDDARVVDLASTLARARFLVLVPDLIGSSAERVRIEDTADIAAAIAHLGAAGGPGDDAAVGVVAISYAVGLAVRASERAEGKNRLGFLAGIGGYYDIAAAVAFITTGKYRVPGETRWRDGRPIPAAKWVFLASNLHAVENASDREILRGIAERRRRAPDAAIGDLAGRLGPEGRALLDLLVNTEVERVGPLIAALPGSLRRHMASFTLEGRDLGHLAGRLILIHGSADPLIPYSESIALAGAVRDTELHIIDGFSHIDTADVPLAARLQLIDAVQALLQRRSD